MLNEQFAVRFLIFVVLITLVSVIGHIGLKYLIAHTGPSGLQAAVGAA